eukprot:SAG31_NODE_1510_length_8062_cov_4.204194_9_plen_56_part_00
MIFDIHCPSCTIQFTALDPKCTKFSTGGTFTMQIHVLLNFTITVLDTAVLVTYQY